MTVTYKGLKFLLPQMLPQKSKKGPFWKHSGAWAGMNCWHC